MQCAARCVGCMSARSSRRPPLCRRVRHNQLIPQAHRQPSSSENGRASVDPVTGAPSRPGGAGMYLHWEGRKGYRTRMPAPRVLEPVPELSYEEGEGNRVIEGDNLQVMISLGTPRCSSPPARPSKSSWLTGSGWVGRSDGCRAAATTSTATSDSCTRARSSSRFSRVTYRPPSSRTRGCAGPMSPATSRRVRASASTRCRTESCTGPT